MLWVIVPEVAFTVTAEVPAGVDGTKTSLGAGAAHDKARRQDENTEQTKETNAAVPTE